MRDSEEGKSFVGMLKDKRIKLGLALGLMVCLNLWVVFDVGWFGLGWTVFVNVMSHLVLFCIEHLWGVASFVVGGGFVVVSSVSFVKSYHKEDVEENKWIIKFFYFPRLLIFLLFLLPLWHFVELISIPFVILGFWTALHIIITYFFYDDIDEDGLGWTFLFLFFLMLPFCIIQLIEDYQKRNDAEGDAEDGGEPDA
ncbi:MAG: hypothetical protein ACTSPB_00445 [Candidatus Thorarchaeota archaeon]